MEPVKCNGLPDDQNKSQMEFAWNTHSYINEYIRFADAKAFGVIVFNSAILGVLMSETFIDVVRNAEWSRTLNWPITFVAVFFWFSVVVIVISLLLCVFVVIPRTKPMSQKHLIFWEGIVEHKTSADYYNELIGKPDSEFKREVVEHNFQLSHVASKKYELSLYAIMFAAGGMVFAFLSFVSLFALPIVKH